MKTALDCVPCFIHQALDLARLVTEDAGEQKVMVRQALGLIHDLDYHKMPLETGTSIHRLISKISGNRDPYAALKKQYNTFALKALPELRKTIMKSRDPFFPAALLTIAGNLIDFGLPHSMNEKKLEGEITKALHENASRNMLEKLQEQIQRASSVLYLGDNAGEIVFDKLFLEFFPAHKTTFCVRGAPILNDATMEDAELIGLTALVKVIDTGLDMPGVVLGKCSKAFQEAFKRADLIISKGQGNYESLDDSSKNIFFLLKAKCPVIARELGCAIGETVVRSTGKELKLL
ncbi:DUF89 domain-containing protein [Fibrobacterota bacterium]